MFRYKQGKGYLKQKKINEAINVHSYAINLFINLFVLPFGLLLNVALSFRLFYTNSVILIRIRLNRYGSSSAP